MYTKIINFILNHTDMNVIIIIIIMIVIRIHMYIAVVVIFLFLFQCMTHAHKVHRWPENRINFSILTFVDSSEREKKTTKNQISFRVSTDWIKYSVAITQQVKKWRKMNIWKKICVRKIPAKSFFFYSFLFFAKFNNRV